ncbi:MAG: 50S ribosomal protein L23 [Candidatus Buchananbacteria bacterium]|nr:50S ribosomal protein L23 [Candidatus Buchananbacteria bacterium]
MSFLDKFKKKQKQEKQEAASKKETKKEAEKKVKDKEAEYETLKAKTESDLPVAPVKSKEAKSAKSKKEDTAEAYKILIKPLVTEKATDLANFNKYCFEIAKNANKIEIQKAIKNLYGVDPLNVNIINMRGKRVRYGRVSGKKKNWKKAIVTLKQGDKIEIYEGV